MPLEMIFGESLVTALEEIMGQDRRVVLIGGGLVGTGSGQAQLARVRVKYSSRIKDPLVDEVGFCGIAAGAAMGGLRPTATMKCPSVTRPSSAKVATLRSSPPASRYRARWPPQKCWGKNESRRRWWILEPCSRWIRLASSPRLRRPAVWWSPMKVTII